MLYQMFLNLLIYVYMELMSPFAFVDCIYEPCFVSVSPLVMERKTNNNESQEQITDNMPTCRLVLAEAEKEENLKEIQDLLLQKFNLGW